MKKASDDKVKKWTCCNHCQKKQRNRAFPVRRRTKKKKEMVNDEGEEYLPASIGKRKREAIDEEDEDYVLVSVRRRRN